MRMVAALAAAPLALGGLAAPALAVQNDVTPSTNELNKAAGWAYYDATPAEDSVTLTFTTTRGFNSCFEYRADDQVATSATHENPLVTDGTYTVVCVNASETSELNPTETVTVPAEEYVEVRLAFGAETDERFDWTRVDVLAEEEEAKPVGTLPDTVAECKKGGWEGLGWSNQGRCVSAVRKHHNELRKQEKAEQRAAAKADKATAKATKKGAKATKATKAKKAKKK